MNQTRRNLAAERGSFALGIGFRWGSGTLTYRAKTIGQGERTIGRQSRVTGSSAYGEIFNLKHLQDFNGHYNIGGCGHARVTLGSGKPTLMSNQAR
jgi:hypothetical protein